MKAIVYDGIQDVKVKKVDDPVLQNHDDIIIKVTSTAICGGFRYGAKALFFRSKIKKVDS